MSGEFGGASVPAELFTLACMLAGILVLLFCIYLELILARLERRSRGRRPEPGTRP